MSHCKIASLLLNLVFALVLAITTLSAQAAVPQTLNYQGQLTNAAGVPVNGTVSMAFKLYDAASNGNLLWSETQPTVTVSNGLYSVTLGQATPLTPTLFGVPLYLGIAVGADAEMTPRIALSSSATALRASLADAATTAVTADTLALTATVDASQISGTISNATISGATLTQLQGQLANSWMMPQANMLTSVDTVGNVGYHTSLSIGADGLPVIAYYDNTNLDLKVARCGNAACSAGNTIASVDTAGDVGLHTSLSIGADGLPVISYYDNTNLDLKVAKCGNAACSAGNTLTTVDTGVSGYTSLSIGTDGLPVISYLVTTGALKVAHCGNAACSTGNTLTVVDASGSMGQYTSIGTGADGLPVISYYDWTNWAFKVAHCGNAACSAGNTITAIDPTVAVLYASVGIGADGLPVISYQHFTTGDLKVVKCGNATCSAGNTITSLDTAWDVGYYNSLSIGADGLPVISYYDNTNFDLKVVKCGNAACSAGNTLTSVDIIGNVGSYTSLSIGADGLPVISYYDVTNGDLKVAKCVNMFCASYFRRR